MFFMVALGCPVSRGAARPAPHHRKNGRAGEEREENKEREESRHNTMFDNSCSILPGFAEVAIPKSEIRTSDLRFRRPMLFFFRKATWHYDPSHPDDCIACAASPCLTFTIKVWVLKMMAEVCGVVWCGVVWCSGVVWCVLCGEVVFLVVHCVCAVTTYAGVLQCCTVTMLAHMYTSVLLQTCRPFDITRLDPIIYALEPPPPWYPPSISKHIQAFPSISKHIQAYPSIFEHIPPPPHHKGGRRRRPPPPPREPITPYF